MTSYPAQGTATATATLVCACGCGEPATNRGGYNAQIRDRVWFASNRCAATFENALIALTAERRASEPDTRPPLTAADVRGRIAARRGGKVTVPSSRRRR